MAGLERICLLTGAGGALGAAFVERFADRYQIVAVQHERPVYFAAQDQRFVDPLTGTEDESANRRRCHVLRADLSQPEEVTALVDSVLRTFGHVEVLVNAAAVRWFSPVLARDAAASELAMLTVNVLAPLWLCRALGSRSWSRDPAGNLEHNRNVVNVSSSAGLYVYPDLGQALYSASKAALNHLTYHLASELWNIGVRVNAVAPDTFPGRVPVDAVLDAIASFDTSDVTGQVLPLVPVPR